ncbi:MAG: hypothetical protein PHW34_09135 [Hespellia sp.]|nr:hypothetical protein [Hespellia sp.]
MTDIVKSEESSFSKFERIAVFIKGYINPSLVQTFTKYIQGHQPEMYIYENYIKKIHPSPSMPVTLEDITAVCTSIALSKEGIDSAIRTYRENRRVYKRNWFASIKDEIESPDNMKPKNPQLLRKYAESKKTVNELNRSDSSDDTTIEEIMQLKYEEMDLWRADTYAPITDFYFLVQKPVKSIANGFINDITLMSLIIIQKHFSGSIDGFNIKFPSQLSHQPIFAYRSSSMEFEPELIENELIFSNHYQYDNDDEGVEGNITVKYNPDAELPKVTSKKSIDKIMREYQIDLKQRELDMKDREIITQLFNMINGETLNEQYIVGNLREFTRRIYNIKVPKKKHYDDIANRLTKLRNYDYTITIKNKASGELLETSSLGLLNYLNISYEDNTFQFTPSDQWVRTYVQKKYTSILSDAYASIDSPQTRGIMMILQQERLTEYKNHSSSKTLTLKYFRSNMKLQRIGNAALIKELTKHLSILQEKKIVVQEFKFVNKSSAVLIEFTSLEPNELVAYEFDTTLLEDQSNVIDADFIEIQEPPKS